ncbi:hypothetical protein BCR32DRAFT_291777 [Anaeromyces robustus]|uniref:MARVEL domain-containing protein n=1 Tax=Anaeromyces robustus TaxID=1754192 RepID=A0A1Y1XEJ0_9FUNG|nr:hypothetical protein BCR32DRAFT_291777 [Anaeromyces robustus]|eukprot:ORX83794.1 hypothetical protein BCR32DRAFT_291777 [Anaeromyces robustus]
MDTGNCSNSTNINEIEDEIIEEPPKLSVKKRVSIQSENFKVSRPSSLQMKQQNYSSPQLINDINNQLNVLKNQDGNKDTSDEKINEIKPISEKLISELSTIAYEIMNNNNKPNKINEKDLIIYTKAMELPRKVDILKEKRVILRILQLIFAIGAFASLSVSSLDVNYNSSIIAESGINSMCLVSISSMMVAFATLFVYFNPKLLNISPQRYYRSSRVEVCVDLLYFAFWIFSSSDIAIYGNCPQNLFDLNKNSIPKCYSWNFCMTFGFCEVGLYLFTFIKGIYDLKTHDWGRRATQKYTGKGVYLWVRGNWKDDERNSNH